MNTRWDNRTLATAGDTPATFGAAVRTFFTDWSPRVLATSAAIALLFRAAQPALSLWDLTVVACIVAWWPLQEWLIHVFLLHFRPRTFLGLSIDPANAAKHRAHHRDPWRVSLIFMPWFSSVPGVAILTVGWHLAMPTDALALTGLATYLCMALRYEVVHFLCHIRWRPPTGHLQRLVARHRLHHFKSEHHWFGVSMLAGDALLGTAPDPRSVDTSDTVRSLHSA